MRNHISKVSSKKAKSIASKLARIAVKRAGIKKSKKYKVFKKATKAALKSVKKSKNGNARKAARKVAMKAA